jgi:hypothetical protein
MAHATTGIGHLQIMLSRSGRHYVAQCIGVQALGRAIVIDQIEQLLL